MGRLSIETKSIAVLAVILAVATLIFLLLVDTLFYILFVLPVVLVLIAIFEVGLQVKLKQNSHSTMSQLKLHIVFIALIVVFVGISGLTRNTVQLYIVAPYEVSKCKERGYPGDRAVGSYLDDPYACISAGFLDSWIGAVYMPHAKWAEGTKEELVRNSELNTSGKMYCHEMDAEWLWCNGN